MSWQDIFVLLVFALVLFGPKKLPEIARSVGRALAVLRRLSHDFEREVRDVAEPFHREVLGWADPDEAEMLKVEQETEASAYPLNPDHSLYAAPPTNGYTDSPGLPQPPPSL